MLKPKHQFKLLHRQQRGFSLIEVLVALLVFSFGVLALVGLQTTALRMAADARDRTTATFLADQLVGLMLISNRAAVGTFRHRTTDGATPCSPGGGNTANAAALQWLGMVNNALPGAESAVQQIIVADAGAAPTNVTQVTVTVCWRRPGAADFSRVTLVNRVPWPGAN
jgi:type IV pilus assembly protein PilV